MLHRVADAAHFMISTASMRTFCKVGKESMRTIRQDLEMERGMEEMKKTQRKGSR